MAERRILGARHDSQLKLASRGHRLPFEAPVIILPVHLNLSFHSLMQQSSRL